MILKQLIEAGIFTTKVEIKPFVEGCDVVAFSNKAGQLCFGGKVFRSIDDAMDAVLAGESLEGSCNGLQFWSWFDEERGAWTPLEHARAKLELSFENKANTKTSKSHPLRVDFVQHSKSSGRIGMTICPGKKGLGLYGGQWDRDLLVDLQQIESWGSNTLITLMESKEFDLLGIENFESTLIDSSFEWYHLPIKDMHAPDMAFEAQWGKCKEDLFSILAKGDDIVIHCRGGLGRTGLLAARMLVELGEAPADAIAKVRSARERSIETYAQEQYILNLRKE